MLPGDQGGSLSKKIDVVGAVIIEGGFILCAQRGKEGNLPGLWEFPGGKIEIGESRQEALRREIHEELTCTIDVESKIVTTLYEYDFGLVSLTTFYCTLVSGRPKASEHDSIRWLHPSQLDTLTWAPADMPAIAQIQKDLN